MNESRRGFIRKFFAGIAAFVLTAGGKMPGNGRAAAASQRKKKAGVSGTFRWGMAIDLDKCTSCGACVVACSQENNLMLGSPQEASLGRIIRWIQILPVAEGEYPTPRQRLLPMPCQQCDDPPCTKVCPVYATFTNEEGIVGQVYARCIGCRYCVNACPYTCKFFNWKAPAWPQEMKSSLDPDVSVRPKGVVEKCLFCHHRLQRAKEEAAAQGRLLGEQDYQPACAEVCPAKAIVFGDLSNPDSDVSSLSQNPRAFHLLEELGTEPKVTYLKEGT